MLDIEEVTKDVLDFWFVETPAEKLFAKDLDLDARIRDRFAAAYEDIQENGHDRYKASPDTSLAAIIILDQFSRNMFRDDPRAFSEDKSAIELTIHSIDNGVDKVIPEDRRCFIYMPLMHSEDLADHEKAVELFSSLINKKFLEFELKHKDIIDRFGRYPHRNSVLDRESTDDEIAFDKEHGGF
jgi:uncharacterized protein (DUF924 family)